MAVDKQLINRSFFLYLKIEGTVFLRFFIFSALISLCILTSCSKRNIPARTEYALGTVCSINAYSDGSVLLYDLCFKRLKDIENKMSVNLVNSEISQINRNAGIKPVFVSPDTLFVLQEACRYAELSNGAFDPTIGPLVQLWGIGTENAHVPKLDEINEAKKLVNWHDIIFDTTKNTVFLTKKGMLLDVGGIAKGYAADEITRIFDENNVKRGIIDLGGNIYVYGEKGIDIKLKNKVIPWKIGIKNPFNTASSPVLSVDLINSAVVTSGVYERFFIEDGKRYHHLLNPSTGYPVDNEVLSFTIICKSSIGADALSTATFVLGKEKGLELLESLTDVEGICITNTKNIVFTKGMQNKMTILANDFRQ